jgi:hypothetical protein
MPGNESNQEKENPVKNSAASVKVQYKNVQTVSNGDQPFKQHGTIKPELNFPLGQSQIPLSTWGENPSFQVTGLGKAELNIGTDGLSFKAKAQMPLYRGDGFFREFNLFSSEANINFNSTKGPIKFGFELLGPNVVVGLPKKTICIRDTAIQPNLEATLALGIGYKNSHTMGIKNGQTKHTAERAFTLPYLGYFKVSGNVAVNPNAPECTPTMHIHPIKTPKRSEDAFGTGENMNPYIPSRNVQKQSPVVPNAEGMNPYGNSNSHGKSKINRSPASLSGNLEESFDALGIRPEDRPGIIEQARNHKLDEQQLNQKLKEVISANKEIQAAEDRKVVFDNINAGIGLLSQIAGVTGCRELQQFCTFAQHGVQIAECVSQLLSPAGFAFGPVVGIASAVIGIFSMFMSSGPNPTQIILDQIKGLSQQINEVALMIQDGQIQNAKMQQEIFNTMVRSFNRISRQIDEGFTTLRIELNAGIQDINAKLNFLVNFIEDSQNKLLLQAFEEQCNAVDLYCKGLFSHNLVNEVQQRSIKFLMSAMNTSIHEGLTGITFYKGLGLQVCTLESELVKSKLLYIYCNPYYSNLALGFFASFYVDLKSDPKNKIVPRKVSNPDVILRAVESYIKLQTIFPQLDIDPNNEGLEEISAVIKYTLDFIKNVKSDHIFWGKLIKSYYDTLEETQKAISNIYHEKHMQKKKNLDDQYTTKKIDYNILANPKELFDQFQPSVPLKFPENIEPIGTLAEKIKKDSRNHKLTTKRISGKFDKLHIEFLAFEYIQGCPSNLFLVLQKEDIKKISENSNGLLKLVKGELLISIKIRIDEKEYEILQLSYTQSTLGDETSNWLSCWNCDELQTTIAQPEIIVTNGANLDSALQKVREKIDEYYKKFRLQIFYELWQEPNYQKLARKLDNHVYFIKCFSYLIGKEVQDDLFKNLVTSQKLYDEMKTFLENKELLAPEQWLTGLKEACSEQNKVIYDKIMKLSDAKVSPLPVGLLMTAQFRLRAYQGWKEAYALQFANLSKYTNIEEYQTRCETLRNHLFQNRVNTEFKNLRANSFNLAKHALASKNHLPIDSSAYINHLLQISYWTQGLSKDSIVTEYLPEVDFTNINESNIQLAKEFIKPYGWAANIRSLMQFAANQAQCNFMIEKGRNGCLQFSEENSPANFVMWSEGVFAYIDILNNLKLEKISQQVGETTESRFRTVLEMYKVGYILNSFINRMAMNENLFKSIFQEYLLILNEPMEWIRLRINMLGESKETVKKLEEESSVKEEEIDKKLKEENNRNSNQEVKVKIKANLIRKKVFELLNTTPYVGARDKMFDKLSFYSACIISYLEMCFGYDVKRSTNEDNFDVVTINSFSQFDISNVTAKHDFILYFDKYSIFKYFDKKDVKEKLDQVLEEHLKNTEDFKNIVLERVDFSYKLFLFKSYLENYFPDNWPTTCLILAKNKTGCDYFTMQQIAVLDEFLARSPNIVSIVIQDISLNNDEMLEAFLKVIIKYQRFAALKFANCNFGKSELTLRLLKNYLSRLPNLQILDLSSNDFGQINDVNRLLLFSEFLECLPQLYYLNLSNNKFNADSMPAVVAGLEQHKKNLEILDLSENYCSPEIARFLCEHFSKLRRLSLADMGLTAKCLFDYLPKLDNLEYLDISNNQFANDMETAWTLATFVESLRGLKVLNISNKVKQAGDEILCALVASSPKVIINYTGYTITETIQKQIDDYFKLESKEQHAAIENTKSQVVQESSQPLEDTEYPYPLPLKVEARIGQPELDQLLSQLVIIAGALSQSSLKEQQLIQKRDELLLSQNKREKENAAFLPGYMKRKVKSLKPVSVRGSIGKFSSYQGK